MPAEPTGITHLRTLQGQPTDPKLSIPAEPTGIISERHFREAYTLVQLESSLVDSTGSTWVLQTVESSQNFTSRAFSRHFKTLSTC